MHGRCGYAVLNTTVAAGAVGVGAGLIGGAEDEKRNACMDECGVKQNRMRCRDERKNARSRGEYPVAMSK